MSYDNVIKSIYELEKHGIKLGLYNIKLLLNKLNNPHKTLKIIHVAGTNGKGSVCAIIASILQEAGFKVGMYTSPHLRRFSERILINSKEIPKKDIVRLYNKVKKYYKNQTFFEFVTAMAFLYFKQKKVDFLVLEVGLGGRLDATNVVDPLISVITNIGLEHTDYLGKTISSVAYEKAGIIKRNKPVVFGYNYKALKVIKKVCKRKNSRLFLVKKSSQKNLKLNLKGDFQLDNAAIALTTIDTLKKFYNIKITKKNIKDGLIKVKWPGRFEFIEKNVLVDCAHNPTGAFALRKEILKIKSNYKKIILVIGILKDKDIAGILKQLVPLANKVIITKAKINRAAEPKKLAEYIKKDFKIIVDVKKALNYAKSIAQKNDLVLVTGSCFVVGEAIR